MNQKQTLSSIMRTSVPAKNIEKFREVLLYVFHKVATRPNVDESVLYKLLYFIDFDFYEKYEERLIGVTYKKHTFGPTPLEFAAIVQDMVIKGEIERVNTEYFLKEQKKYLPLRNADLNILSAQELNLIDEVINRFADKSENQISEYLYGDIPWLVTKNQGVIEYETVF